MPGLSHCVQGGTSGYAIRRTGLRTLDRQFDLFHRLYARQQGEEPDPFFICFALALSATMGVAFAGNLLTLFLFYELLTLSTYPLVSHKGDAATVRSARVYLGILLTTSIGLFLPAIIWTYTVAGTGDFTPGGILAGKLDDPEVGCCWHCSYSASVRPR